MDNPEIQFAKTMLLGVMGLAVAAALKTRNPLLLKCPCGARLTFELAPPVKDPTPAHMRVGELEHEYPFCSGFLKDPVHLLAYVLFDRITALAEHVPEPDFQHLASGVAKMIPNTFGFRTEA